MWGMAKPLQRLCKAENPPIFSLSASIMDALALTSVGDLLQTRAFQCVSDVVSLGTDTLLVQPCYSVPIKPVSSHLSGFCERLSASDRAGGRAAEIFQDSKVIF